jgi:anti-sigma regulatory factor (Ser/Thr protein kinase)
VLDGCPMENLVQRADELLRAHNPALVATVLAARYTPSSGRLRLAGAGHPPMLHITPGGDVREVAAPGIAIGWPEAGSFEVVELTLGRSETALFYTDGLVEGGGNIVQGLKELGAAASATAGYPTAHLPRVLIERALRGATRRDDTLALVLRRRQPPPPSSRHLLGALEHRFSPTLAAVPVARNLFAEWLRLQPLDSADHDDLTVVVSELCTNAVRMATGEPGGVVLRAWPDGDALIIEVTDDGPSFEGPIPRHDDIPSIDQIAGRGLFIVQAMVDELGVRRVPEGTVVRCVKRCLFPERTEPGGDDI